MPVKPLTRPIAVTKTLGAADPLEIRSGPSIPAVERVKLFSAAEWEGCVDEWASSLSSYGLVERAGAAGDMGCDVIATVDPSQPDSPWDIYQCKHYDHPLAPSDIWVELGKLCYYTHTGAYDAPRHYVLVAPRGVGIKLMRLLKQSEDLRSGLIAAWPEKCRDKLTASGSIPLEGELLAHVQSFDFGRVRHLPPVKLIEGLMSTRFFAVRFGLGLPQRPAPSLPPDEIALTRLIHERP